MGKFINESRNHIKFFQVDLKEQTVTVLLRDVPLATIIHHVEFEDDNESFGYSTRINGLEPAIKKAEKYLEQNEADYQHHIAAIISASFLMGE